MSEQNAPLVETGPPGQRWLYTEGEFLRDYNRALQAYTVPGYPAFEDRLRLNDLSELGKTVGGMYVENYIPYDADAPWCVGDHNQRQPEYEPKFIDEGEVYPPSDDERKQWQAAGIRLDQRGMPLHPFAEAMLLGGHTPDGKWIHTGGVVTPGAYFRRGRGPQKTADMLLMAEKDDVLHGLFIERSDNGQLAIPGGHLEPEDAEDSQELYGKFSEYEIAGIRELEEETGIALDISLGSLSCDGVRIDLHKIWAGCGADQRATLHAWPQGEAFTAFLPAMPAQQPRASSDAEQATWLPMDTETLNRLAAFSNHRAIGRRAIRVYRDKKGARVDADGIIQ